MRRIRLLIQYDGTDFCGWADQPNVRTVQGTLTDCIRRVSGEEVELTGASRTDSGAHAIGQCADFSTPVPVPADKWSSVLNRQLPLDVRILKSDQVPDSFHSRFCARSRQYVYRLSRLDKVEPFRSRYVHAVGKRPDLSAMNAACKLLIGTHDFRGFGEELKNVQNSVRTVLKAQVSMVRDEYRIRIEATAFIRGMMRRIAGGLYEVGIGRRTLESFSSVLNLGEACSQLPEVLPARGLTLESIRYGRKLRDLRFDEEFDDVM
jgi:tRNA pseudouridine38-40 synthase